MTRTFHLVSFSLCSAVAAMALVGCGQENAQSTTATPSGASTSLKIEAPTTAGEQWVGKAGDWELAIHLETTEVGGTKFQEGAVTTNKAACMPSGKISGNMTSKGTVTWVANSGTEAEFVVEGTVSGDAITGTFEFRGDAAGCATRVPVTLARAPLNK